MEYKTALTAIDETSWKTLENGAKLEVLQAIENELARLQSREPGKVTFEPLPDSAGRKTLGVSRANYHIVLNAGEFAGPAATTRYLLMTLAHESRHTYQRMAVAGLVKHTNFLEVRNWKKCIENPIDPAKSFKGYLTQSVERDAVSFSLTMTRRLEDDRAIAKSERETVKTTTLDKTTAAKTTSNPEKTAPKTTKYDVSKGLIR
jgi:hypothetical protein